MMATTAWYQWPAGQPVTTLEIDQAPSALSGQADMGAVVLAGPTANPAAISATVLSEAGNLNGAYQYVMTETMGAIDGNGNLHPAGTTAAGTASNVVNASDNPVSLGLPAPSATAISRTIWRTTAGGSTFYFLVTIVNPQVSTWTDNVADADLGTATAPTINTTGTVLLLALYDAVPAMSAPAGSLIAVSQSGGIGLYQSTGSGWAPYAQTDVANIFTAQQTVLDLAVSGLPGATVASRYVGGTSGGPPTTGTFAVGDFVSDATSHTFWQCTVAGTPGTWVTASPLATIQTPGVVQIAANPASGNPVVSSQVGSAQETELTTTSATTIVTYTPAIQGNYSVRVYYRVVTASTAITITVSYADAGGAQTDTLVNATQAVGSYWAETYCDAVSGTALTVSATAGTADQVYVSATMEAV